ncbi:MAG: ACT domain-containing protein [Oscillospiraceae bacterium]
MWKPPKYLVVETEALPEVFAKVVYAKQLLENGETGNISHAAKMAGISRSAIYKYRDAVFPYVREMSGKVVNLYVLLRDKPGMLSTIIAELYRNGANILTINQNIPVDGMAAVSVSVSLDATSTSDMEILNAVKKLDGVIEARRLSAH